MAKQLIENGEAALSVRTKLNENFTELYNHMVTSFNGWGYQDFAAGSITTTSVIITANSNGTGFTFSDTKIINSSAVIVRASDNNKIPYTGSTTLFSSKVSVTGNIGEAVTLSGVPDASWGDCRIFYRYTYEKIPTGYTMAPKFVSSQILDALDESFVTYEMYATGLAAKELKSNKQNSLEPDGTGTKFPTVDAVNEGLEGKVNTTDIEQVRSQATNKVPASKLFDDELTALENVQLPLKANHGYESNPKTLKEVDDNLAQLAGDIHEMAPFIEDLHSAINYTDLVQGSYLFGSQTDNSTRIRVDYPIDVNPSSGYEFKCNAGYLNNIQFLNPDGSYAGSFTGFKNVNDLNPIGFSKILLMVSKANNTNITPSDAPLVGLTQKEYNSTATKIASEKYADNVVNVLVEPAIRNAADYGYENSFNSAHDVENLVGLWYRLDTNLNARQVIFPIQHNTTYTIEKEASTRFRIMSSIDKPEKDGDPLNTAHLLDGDGLTTFTFTNNDTDNWLLIYVSNTGQEPYLTLTGRLQLRKEVLPKIGFEPIHNPKSKWEGKIINWLGDSITAPTNSYAKVASNILGATCNNYGISLSTIANSGVIYNPMCTRYTEMDDSADLICVLASRNDYRVGPLPFGDLQSIDINTFCGAARTLIYGLWNKYPTKTIVFFTMFKARCATDPETLDSEFLNPTTGKNQDEYNDVIRAICKECAIPVIDLYNEGNFNSWNLAAKAAWFADTVHPNQVGHNYLGQKLASILTTL